MVHRIVSYQQVTTTTTFVFDFRVYLKGKDSSSIKVASDQGLKASRTLVNNF